MLVILAFLCIRLPISRIRHLPSLGLHGLVPVYSNSRYSFSFTNSRVNVLELSLMFSTFQMATKQSQAELVRLLESGIREVGGLDRRRFFIIVHNVIATGSPPERLVASVLVRFLPDGAPYCCGEPSCYSRAFRDDGIAELGDFLQRKMNLRQTVSVELKVRTEYYDGISFSAFSPHQDD